MNGYRMCNVVIIAGALGIAMVLGWGGAGRAGGPVQSDPARLARIRAAKMPAITRPVLFDTPRSGRDSARPWRSSRPTIPGTRSVEIGRVHPNSQNIVASIGAEKPLRCNADMGFILVPPNQKRVDVKIVGYPGESDHGPFPVPDNVPIEGWPARYRNVEARELTLDDVQRDKISRTAIGTPSSSIRSTGCSTSSIRLKKTDARLAGGRRRRSSI